MQQNGLAADQGRQKEKQLRGRHIRAGHPGIIGQPALGNGEEVEQRIVDGEGVGAVAVDGNVAVPNVAVDIVRKRRRRP